MFILYSIRAMFIQIEDPSDLPRPPEEVSVRAIQVDPYPDGQRLRVTIDLTPFLEAPDLVVRVLDANETELAEVSIIGAHQPTLGLTVHLKKQTQQYPYSLDASVRYEELGEVNQFSHSFEPELKQGDD